MLKHSPGEDTNSQTAFLRENDDSSTSSKLFFVWERVIAAIYIGIKLEKINSRIENASKYYWPDLSIFHLTIYSIRLVKINRRQINMK